MNKATAAPLVVTCGDPAGIGPDIILTLHQQGATFPWVILADEQVLQQRAALLGIPLDTVRWLPGDALPPATHLPVWHHPVATPVVAGQADPRNGQHVMDLLTSAANACLSGDASAMVTAPIAKHVICDSVDPQFTGHTEFLAAQAGCQQVVMMLANADFRVALVTTHLPLRAVADAIQADTLKQVLHITERSLQQFFGIEKPRLLVLGLNPHAGENGHLGHEEIDIIAPTLAQLRQAGMHLTGPLPADTAFNQTLLQAHDVVIAMYHDQGLPVLKYAGFGDAVNITLGLPFIRTSVDHGTAFDLAGTGKAQASSLNAALTLAQQLTHTRRY